MLAVDISGSVDRIEARLQREGYIAALRHPDVVSAIQGGMFGRIALAYVEWAGDHYQRTMLDWTVIEDPAGAHAFADALAETPLLTAHWTSLSGAIDYAAPLFDHNGIEGVRRVIDISGDGYNNRGRPVRAGARRGGRGRHHDQRPADRQRPPEPLGRHARRPTSTATTRSW